jgi:hypothetical protein|tara:strand:+ start:1166 stop:1588 length:423 start_codon:yes stop_codon:yes gene_type:complete
MLLKLLLMLSLSASATEEPKFTILEYKAPAPFAGILFDEQAMAKILARYDLARYACEIKTDYQLKIQKEEYDFRLENLRIEHKSLTDEYDLFIIQKDMEIKALSNSLKKTSPRHKWLYFAGGVIIGTASSYNVYRIVNGR